MKKLNLFLIAGLLLIFPFSSIFGQEEEEKTLELKKFGMGLHIEQFRLVDISTDITTAPANKLVFTINASQKFRIEPEIGFMYYSTSGSDQGDLSLSIGSGIYGMFQKWKTNFYWGLKLEYAYMESENSDYYGGSYKSIMSRLSAGPALGAEYFLGKHFSVGGELGLIYMNLNRRGGSERNRLSTETGLLLRFYF
jgi:hypothetical protein